MITKNRAAAGPGDRYTLPVGPFPGFQSVGAQCDARLAGYVGSGHAADFYDWLLVPDQYTWATGDHVVVCVLGPTHTELMTGSAHQAH